MAVVATAVEVVAAIWEAVVADSMVVADTAEVLADTTVDTAVEVTPAVITAARSPAAMLAEEHTAADIQVAVPLLPGRGRGKARARRGAVLLVGMDLLGITVP